MLPKDHVCFWIFSCQRWVQVGSFHWILRAPRVPDCHLLLVCAPDISCYLLEYCWNFCGNFNVTLLKLRIQCIRSMVIWRTNLYFLEAIIFHVFLHIWGVEFCAACSCVRFVLVVVDVGMWLYRVRFQPWKCAVKAIYLKEVKIAYILVFFRTGGENRLKENPIQIPYIALALTTSTIFSS